MVWTSAKLHAGCHLCVRRRAIHINALVARLTVPAVIRLAIGVFVCRVGLWEEWKR